MIRFIIDRASARKSDHYGWLVEHPSNAAILAYCDSETEALTVAHALAALGASLATERALFTRGEPTQLCFMCGEELRLVCDTCDRDPT